MNENETDYPAPVELFVRPDGAEELKPCPFCGAAGEVICSTNDQKQDTYCVSCVECSCSLGEDKRNGAGDWADSHNFLSSHEACIAWNKRPNVQVQPRTEAGEASCSESAGTQG